jgi:hypothetical protein
MGSSIRFDRNVNSQRHLERPSYPTICHIITQWRGLLQNQWRTQFLPLFFIKSSKLSNVSYLPSDSLFPMRSSPLSISPIHPLTASFAQSKQTSTNSKIPHHLHVQNVILKHRYGQQVSRPLQGEEQGRGFNSREDRRS